MTAPNEVAIARAKVARARQNLDGSMGQILSRFTPAGIASQAFGVKSGRNVDWLALGFRLYRYRGTAMTVLGLLASLKARKKRKEAEREAEVAKREARIAPLLSARAQKPLISRFRKGVSEMADNLKDSANTTREKIGAAADTAAAKAADARDRASKKVGDAYSYSRDRSQELGSRLVENIKANPVTAVVGGIALGILAGALLPRLRGRSATTAGAAAAAFDRYRSKAAGSARDTLHVIGGRLDELGINRENARDTLNRAKDVVQDVTSIASGAARDALQRARRDV